MPTNQSEIFDMTTVLSKTAIVLVMLHLLVGGQALDFESVGEKIMKKIGKLDFPPVPTY